MELLYYICNIKNKGNNLKTQNYGKHFQLQQFRHF